MKLLLRGDFMPDIIVQKETLESILETIKTLEKQLEKLLSGQINTISVNLGEIRYIAPLAEIHNHGGIVSSDQII